VTRRFVRQGLALTIAGVALGLAGAAASTRFLQSWLYGVTTRSIRQRLRVDRAAGMVGIAALASYLPARRAARVDPLVALRAE
jgi:ABC-type lipoprotein release transport system permease subunit